MNELNVFLNGTLVGQLRQSPGGAMTFAYDNDYRTSPGATPLSLSMPLSGQNHKRKPTRAYFAGLLPDSSDRLNEIAREFGVSPNNPFALLEHIGHDAPGAVQLLRPGLESTSAERTSNDIDYLTDQEFTELIRDLVTNAATWGKRGSEGKWSLPGAEPKVALFRNDDGRWGVPRGSTPTTHIIKPAVYPYLDHHINEFVTMEAARALGLNVADSFLLRTDAGDNSFVSVRYDRIRENGLWMRRHQEDLCQSLSVMPAQKYQDQGGPGIAAVSQLFKQFPHPADRAAAATTFFDAIVFNTSALGTDAHAKNYSLLLDGNRVEFAPFYDLGTHGPYPMKDGQPMKAAMSVRGTYRINGISDADLINEGTKLGLDRDTAADRVNHIRAHVSDAFATAAETAIASLDDSAFAHNVAQSIEDHARAHGWS
ncbi:MAG: HipA domain-containing protein [Terrimesophilobacter sp.]